MKQTLFKLMPAVKIQTDFYVFDTETNGLRAKQDAFIFGVIYGHKFVKVLYTVKEFQNEFLLPRYKGKKIFAHNAEYDLGVIYDNIYAFDSKAIFNGKFICATNGNCQFADSMNIYQTSVKKIGDMIGLKKQELDQSYHSGKQAGKIKQKDIDYCIRDCEIVYEALFQAFEFTGQIKITQASLSLSYFKRYHLPFNIKHDSKQTKHFYDSYYGGRTECFKLGKTYSLVYDVNSMYPFVMRKNKFPNPNGLSTFHIQNPTELIQIKKFLRSLSQYEGCANIEVIHKDVWIGFLPVRKDGKLIFPVGQFSGTWNFPEIRFAIEHGIIEIIAINSYTFGHSMDSPFTSFVDHLYSERFKSSNSFSIFRLKIFMNSLYGKLAQRILQETTYIDDINSAESIGIIENYMRKNTFISLDRFNAERSDAFLTTKTSRNSDSLPYSIPSFSSYITSYARIILLTKLLECKDRVPVYCDTDSIFMEKEVVNNELIKPKLNNIPILGAWKIEDKIVTNIRGLKNYEYIEENEIKRALKGVPKTATEIEPNKWVYYNLTKTKEALRRNIESGIRIKRTKVLSEKYDKRIVNLDGSTEPIKI